MKKIAFIIPGYSESKKNNPAYVKIASYFKNKGIQSVIVDVNWKYKTISDYVEQFKGVYHKNKKYNEVYFLGFSYGAMISFISSVELKPKAQILCSLSPYFKEDFPYIREWWKRYIGQKRLADFRKTSFNDLARKISAKTIILAGDKEGKEVDRRVKEANKRIRNSKLIIIPKARHKIGQKEYLEEVKKIIDKL
jgi:esterase/lipase